MMRTYLLRRLALLVFVLIGGVATHFHHLSRGAGRPCTPGRRPASDGEAGSALRQKLGLDRPLPEQYVNYVAGLLRLDFGYSLTSRRPVRKDLQEYFPATIELALAAMLISLVVGIPLGVLSAVHRDTFLDHVSRVICIAGVALPIFWLAMLFQLVFYRRLGIFPSGMRIATGMTPPPTVTGLYTVDSLLARDWPALASSLWHLAMPALVLAFASLAWITRITRTSVLETLRQDYVRTARGKGLAERSVVYRHVLRNALDPHGDADRPADGGAAAGTFLVEIIFSWPGIGFYTVNAVMAMDFNAIMGTTLLVAVVYTVINLVVDVVYVALDPRISYS